MRRVGAVVALAVMAAAGSACRSTEPRARSIEASTFNDTLRIDLTRFTRLASGMYLRDSVVGTGAVLAPGRLVQIRYVGFFPDGTIFDRRVAPASRTFELGAGEAIQGWELGLPGMRVGGTRLLVVPPELGYGSEGRGPVPPDAVMVFRIEAVSVQ